MFKLHKTILVFSTVLILLASFSFASVSYPSLSGTGDGCIVNETCTYYAYANGGVVDAVKISVHDSTGTFLINNQDMIAFNSDTYAFNHTHTTTGSVVVIIDFFNNSVMLGAGSESKDITLSGSLTTTEEFEMLAEIFEPFLYFAIGLLIALLGQYLLNPMFFIGSGVWFVGLAAAVFLGTITVSILGGAFFALLGIGLIYHGGKIFLEEGF